MATVKQDSILREADILQIEKVLYAPKEKELVARKILAVNTNFIPGARSVEYDSYTRKGSAKLFAKGASAKDIPKVGEDLVISVQKVYDIATSIGYDLGEMESLQARNILGKGPIINIDTLRVETARRYVSELEDRLVLVGDTNFGIRGLINRTGVPAVDAVDVAQGAFTGTAAQKRLWINKTPREKITDLRNGLKIASNDGTFMPDTLVLPFDQYNQLLEPYSDQSPMTVLNWIQTQGVYFKRIIVAKQLTAAFNGLGGVDCFIVMDSSREVAEIAVPRELTLMEPVYDLMGNSEQAVLECTAGAIIRHPSAIYVGKGI